MKKKQKLDLKTCNLTLIEALRRRDEFSIKDQNLLFKKWGDSMEKFVTGCNDIIPLNPSEKTTFHEQVRNA